MKLKKQIKYENAIAISQLCNFKVVLLAFAYNFLSVRSGRRVATAVSSVYNRVLG